MTQEKFDELKELKDRTFQLTLIKRYMEGMLSTNSFYVELKTSVLGTTRIEPMPFNSRFIEHNDYLKTPDGEYIVTMLQKRIDELEKAFKEA